MRVAGGWSIVPKGWQKSAVYAPYDVVEAISDYGLYLSREEARKNRGPRESVVSVRVSIKSEKGN